MTIDEIEDILYTGSKEEILKVLEEYKITYKYNEQYNSLYFESGKLNEIIKAKGCHYIPKCVVYFGKKYN